MQSIWAVTGEQYNGEPPQHTPGRQLVCGMKRTSACSFHKMNEVSFVLLSALTHRNRTPRQMPLRAMPDAGCSTEPCGARQARSSGQTLPWVSPPCTLLNAHGYHFLTMPIRSAVVRVRSVPAAPACSPAAAAWARWALSRSLFTSSYSLMSSCLSSSRVGFRGSITGPVSERQRRQASAATDAGRHLFAQLGLQIRHLLWGQRLDRLHTTAADRSGRAVRGRPARDAWEAGGGQRAAEAGGKEARRERDAAVPDGCHGQTNGGSHLDTDTETAFFRAPARQRQAHRARCRSKGLCMCCAICAV